MTLRCDRCGELVWFSETSEKWLRCSNCGKTVENPNYEDSKDSGCCGGVCSCGSDDDGDDD